MGDARASERGEKKRGEREENDWTRKKIDDDDDDDKCLFVCRRLARAYAHILEDRQMAFRWDQKSCQSASLVTSFILACLF